jgi:hypothetical protein
VIIATPIDEPLADEEEIRAYILPSATTVFDEHESIPTTHESAQMSGLSERRFCPQNFCVFHRCRKLVNDVQGIVM